MGTAHVLVAPCFLAKIDSYPDAIILQIGPEDLDGYRNILVQSSRLPDGYNGQTEAFFRDDGVLHFRRETDT